MTAITLVESILPLKQITSFGPKLARLKVAHHCSKLMLGGNIYLGFLSNIRDSSTARGWTDAPSPAQMSATKNEPARETTCAIGASDDGRQPSGWDTGAASRIKRPEHVENNETSPLSSCLKPTPTSMRRAAGAPSTKSGRVSFVTQVDVRQENVSHLRELTAVINSKHRNPYKG